MPQIDLYYSSDLSVDCDRVFSEIVEEIKSGDPSSGVCKCRAHKISDFRESHVLIGVRVLDKPHRDQVMMQGLLEKIKRRLAESLPAKCQRAIELGFLSRHYESF